LDHKRVAAKKRLGQNFLRDAAVIRRIVKSLELAATDTVLEVGCGTGALTRDILAAKPALFIGVELDKSLCADLSSRYSSPSVVFLNQDILQLEIDDLMGRLKTPGVKIKVVGNLPYYISSPIIEWLGRHSQLIESATVMLQAEVASRLMASPGTRDF
jgi:16S rRNA (adenine1518-N6/adenine1519-N6)-dimethyltransferase